MKKSRIDQQKWTCILDGHDVLVQALHEAPAGLLIEKGNILPEHRCQVAVADAIGLAGPCSEGSCQVSITMAHILCMCCVMHPVQKDSLTLPTKGMHGLVQAGSTAQPLVWHFVQVSRHGQSVQKQSEPS